MAGECWLLELIPDTYPRWLLCIRSAGIVMSAKWSGLALVEADKSARLTHGMQRNILLLQQLWNISGCDRMILWRCTEMQMIPVHMLGAAALPESQPLDLRYKKIIRQRKSIGFSNPGSVPMLQEQHYLAADGIRARLDLPITLPRTGNNKEMPLAPDYLLTLEYRSLQSSFTPVEYQSAELLTSLLFQDKQPPELQPLSSLDAELIKLSDRSKMDYWYSLSKLFQQQVGCQLLAFDPLSSRLIFPAISHDGLTTALCQLASRLSSQQTMQSLDPQQLKLLQDALNSPPIAAARTYRIKVEQGEPPLLLLWSDLADQRWSDADAIFQLTYWHSLAECPTTPRRVTPAPQQKNHSRLRERLIQKNRLPARKK